MPSKKNIQLKMNKIKGKTMKNNNTRKKSKKSTTKKNS